MSYEIREATQDERDRFVRSTWRRSFATGRHAGTPLGRGDYFSLRGELGTRIAARWWLDMHAKAIDATIGACNVLMATIEDECIGWVAYDSHVLHYCYVAPRFRRNGVGKALLRIAVTKAPPSAPTHLTTAGEALLRSVLREQPRSTDVRQQGQAAHDG